MHELLLSEYGCETTDLSAERGADLLRRVGDQVFHGWHNVGEKGVTLNERAETRDLTSNGSSYFCFGILEELDEGWDKITADDLFVYSLGNLRAVSILVV